MQVSKPVIVAAAFIFVFFVLPVAYAACVYQIRIPGMTAVKVFGGELYWDSAAQNEVALIDWGNVFRGEAKNVTVYLKNTGDLAVTGFVLNTENFVPNHPEWFTLSWSLSVSRLEPAQVIQVVLTLMVSQSAEGSVFSFDIVITLQA